MNRLGLTPFEFYQLTPVEFDWALKDFNDIQFTPMKRICEALRIVAQITHNSTFGRDKNQMIRDPKRIIRFGWETPKVQTMEEMRSFVLGLSHMSGVKVEQHGKEVDPFAEDEQTLTRTK